MPPKRRASDSVPETAIEVELRMQLEQDKLVIAAINERLSALETKVSYYDKMALKAGFFSMGFLCFGAALAMGVDDIKKFFISRMLP